MDRNKIAPVLVIMAVCGEVDGVPLRCRVVDYSRLERTATIMVRGTQKDPAPPAAPPAHGPPVLQGISLHHLLTTVL